MTFTPKSDSRRRSHSLARAARPVFGAKVTEEIIRGAVLIGLGTAICNESFGTAPLAKAKLWGCSVRTRAFSHGSPAG